MMTPQASGPTHRRGLCLAIISSGRLFFAAFYDCRSGNVRQDRDGNRDRVGRSTENPLHPQGSLYSRRDIIYCQYDQYRRRFRGNGRISPTDPGYPFWVWLLIITATTISLEVFVSYPAYARLLKYLTLSLLPTLSQSLSSSRIGCIFCREQSFRVLLLIKITC